jgi:histone chaperone ASF1
VNNYYEEPELNENPPLKPDITKLTRHILVEKPRVTKFQIDWDDHSFTAGTTDENNQNIANIQ